MQPEECNLINLLLTDVRSASSNASKPVLITKPPAPAPQVVYQSTTVTLTLPPKHASTPSVNTTTSSHSAPIPNVVATKTASAYVPSSSSPIPNKIKTNNRASSKFVSSYNIILIYLIHVPFFLLFSVTDDGAITPSGSSPKVPPKPQDLNDR